MKIVCAWCGKELSCNRKSKSYVRLDESLISHGICNECYKKIKAEIKEMIKKGGGSLNETKEV